MDRITFGILVPQIRKDMVVDDPTYGRLTLAFEMTYMIGFLIMGKFVERYGTRIGYTVAVAWWSLAAVLHGLAKPP
jgi:ACS family hexuronate transporter-like MFS transporter